MYELREWIRQLDLPRRPWLLLGKGPTLARLESVDVSQFNTLCLNHVVRDTKVDVAHVIDADVVDDCGHAILRNCRYLLMPRYPHVQCDPTSTPLEEFVSENPVLRQMDAEGRLVWYNLSSSPPVGKSPVIQARYFSAEAALRILGEMGVNQVRTLGVDGGRGYSRQYTDLERTTMLANGRSSFDEQTGELAEISRHYQIDLSPLAEPMRVFVGTDESQLVATRVLEHSIRKHTKEPLTVHPMMNLNIAKPKHHENRPRTGFSFARFLIPQLCGYRGRALYVDADMQVFSDLAELWQIPFGDQKVLCTNQPETPEAWEKHGTYFKSGRQMSVMLLDCARLDWRIEDIIAGLDEERYNYRDLMFDMCVVRPEEIEDRIPPEWNCLESFEPGRSKLVHYTVVPTQPWKNDENPLRHVWERGYREAVAEGAVTAREVYSGVRQRFLKKSLLEAFSETALAQVREESAEGKPEVRQSPRIPASYRLRRLAHAARRSIRDPLGAFRRVMTGTWK